MEDVQKEERPKLARTQEGDALTDLIIETFRFNGSLIEAGNELTRPMGLTSARWQVMGTVAMEGQPLSVSQIGRAMGLTRQGVQRVVNELVRAGFVELRDNPADRRARLVALTQKGRAAQAEVDAAQLVWVNALSDGVSLADIRRSVALLRQLRERLCAAKASDSTSRKSESKRLDSAS